MNNAVAFALFCAFIAGAMFDCAINDAICGKRGWAWWCALLCVWSAIAAVYWVVR
jgi:hypothetical protein